MPSNDSSKSWPFIWGERTIIMGVVNLTPDSFSGDGLADFPDLAVERARTLVAAGADLIDLGAESSRPGYHPVPAIEEGNRLLPVLTRLNSECRPLMSVDTRKAGVAEYALRAGARIVNDISGLADPEMTAVVAAHGAGLIIVHNGEPEPARDLVVEVTRRLDQLVNLALAAGVGQDAIVVDPGLGMGKDWRANLVLIRRLREFRLLGLPLMVGPSRKGMIGRVLGVTVGDRLEGTAALVTLCIAGGADMVRVHDVPQMSRVVRMTDALVR